MINIYYGEQLLELNIPKKNLVFELKPKQILPLHEVEKEIKQALNRPIGSARLNELVKPSMKVLILADDRTRLTPQHLIIPLVLEELNKAGVPDSRISILMAYGTHRRMNDEEVEEKLGREVVKRIRVLHHDCLDMKNLVDHNVTSRGTRIFVNKDYMEADFRIGIGGILPHHPTGWSGGAKILLPGVAGQETVTAMHLLGATEQQLGKIQTPCRQEMEDFAKEVGLEFIINVLNDSHGNILKIVAGDFIAAHRKGIEYGKEVYGAPFTEQADITLSSTHPGGDFDLTQADKGLFSAEIATKIGGEIILLSPCYEGIAPTHGDEMALLARYNDEELWQLLEEDKINDRFCASENMYLNHIKTNFTGILMTDDPMLTTLMGFLYLNPKDLQRYIDYKIKLNENLKIGIVHESASTLPVFTEG